MRPQSRVRRAGTAPEPMEAKKSNGSGGGVFLECTYCGRGLPKLRSYLSWFAIPRNIFALGVLPFFIITGCSDSKRTEQIRGATNGEEPTTTQATRNTPGPADSPKSLTSNTNFHPVPLDQFYQRQFVDYQPTESWAQVPRGETNFDGVPFLMFGKIDLTGLGRARDGEFQPPRVGEIPAEGRAARVHLMHGASYDSPDGTPVACVLLRYENGEARRLFIRYGVHVRNWYVEANEAEAALLDARSLEVWNGNSRSDGSGKPTRLFKTTFDNPLPAQKIRAIELLSLFARANSVILAITLEDSPGAAPPASTEDEDDSQFRREDVVRALDADTGQTIQNVSLQLSVTEGARTYRFGAYSSDARGQIRIIYPPARFQKLIGDVKAPGYLPMNFEISSDEGIFGPDLPVRLKRQPAK